MSKLNTDLKKQVLAGHDLSGFTQEQIDMIENILISTINDCSDFIVSHFDFCGEEILIAEALSEFYQTDWSYDDDRDSDHES